MMRTKLVVLITAIALFFPRSALAFCGFYVGGADAKLFNNATMVVMMREGQRTVLSMQNNYQGPPERFAMVVPVPVVLQKENVKTLPREIFGRVDQLAAPRLVEYWEQDPCAPPMVFGAMRRGAVHSPPMAAPAGAAGLGVKIEAQFTVGEYEIVILSAQDAAGLDTWLRRENYKIPDGAAEILRPYVTSGMKFFVAKVDVTKIKFENGMAMLSPLRFHYDTPDFNLPIRLGLVNSGGTQDLIVHILAKGQRYDVVNYPNVTIPTNFDVAETAKDKFGSFYAALFDRTIEKTPKAVVTEYAWDASTCDPCPSPALDMSELMTLGADVLPSASPVPPGGAPPPQMRPMGRPMYFPSGFVLTRLHTRYAKESVGADLVFREAPPIAGGREVRITEGKLEHGAQPGGTNNFQGRYAIRHPWTGPIACEHPMRGTWGGPPQGVAAAGDARPKAATNLAFVPRGNVQLASMVKEDIPELDVKPGAVGAMTTPPMASAAPATPGSADPVAPRAARGCGGCRVGAAEGAAGSLFFAGFLALTWVARRRSR